MIEVKKITTRELLQWKENHKEFQFIDIRPYKAVPEFIDKVLKITLQDIDKNIHKIRKDIPVVVACDVGQESFFAAHILEEKYKFNNIYSLSGGINKLMQELD